MQRKKVILFAFALILCSFLMAGCTDMMNTPSKRVEEFLGKYQMMDSDVLEDLNDTVEASEYSSEGKEEYKSLMQKQYQNLTYKIKNEETNGDQAKVEVEIEVFDYANALEEANTYIEEHEEEFEEEENKSRSQKIEEYKIKQLKAVTDKANYTLNFSLTKQDKRWILNPISDVDVEKIHGLYPSV